MSNDNRARLSTSDLITASFGIAREHSDRPPRLVRIFGLGIGKDGTMRAAVRNMMPRWEFMFRREPDAGFSREERASEMAQDKTGFFSVLWLAAAMSGENQYLKPKPQVDKRAGNISDDAQPLSHENIGHEGEEIPSSLEVAERAFKEGAELAFRDEDTVLYHRAEGEDVIDVISRERFVRFRLEDFEVIFKSTRDP